VGCFIELPHYLKKLPILIKLYWALKACTALGVLIWLWQKNKKDKI